MNNPQNPKKVFYYNFSFLLNPQEKNDKFIEINEYIHNKTEDTRSLYSIKLPKGIKKWSNITIILGGKYYTNMGCN